MPIETSLPFPNPQQNLRIGWPDVIGALTIGGGMVLTGFADGLVAPNVWGASVGAGVNVMQHRNNLICASFDDTVIRPLVPTVLLNPLVTNLGAGYVGAEWQRVYRLTVQLSMDGNLTQASGVSFGPSAGVTQNEWTAAGGAAFGVVGDNTGGWEYLQSDSAAFPGNITDQVAIGAAIVPSATDWNTFVFEIINSAPGRTATMSLTVNGVLVVSRNWVAPLALPLFAEVANSNKYVFGARNDTIGVDLFVGPLTIEMGRFTGAGLEILS